MKHRPPDLDEELLVASLAEGWAFAAATAEFCAVGFGSYHWVVADAGGARRFVTVDDLDQKGWLGATRGAAFGGLGRAFDAAAALRELGLEFVVAPIRADRGGTVVRLGPRYTVALFPFVAGRTGSWGEFGTSADRAAVVEILADLHRATAALEVPVTARGIELPGRDSLESALRDVDEPWTGGPFSEPARTTLARHAADVGRLLDAFDALAAVVRARGFDSVVTHGEPHPGNVLHAADGPLLVDWDTVALAPPERDLWMVGDATSDEVALYADRTGREVDPRALELFRLGWDLSDLTEYLSLFRSPHSETEDTTKAYEGVTRLVRRPTP